MHIESSFKVKKLKKMILICQFCDQGTVQMFIFRLSVTTAKSVLSNFVLSNYLSFLHTVFTSHKVQVTLTLLAKNSKRTIQIFSFIRRLSSWSST